MDREEVAFLDAFREVPGGARHKAEKAANTSREQGAERKVGLAGYARYSGKAIALLSVAGGAVRRTATEVVPR